MGGPLKRVFAFFFSLVAAFLLSYTLVKVMPGAFQDDEFQVTSHSGAFDLSLGKISVSYLKGEWGTSWQFPDRNVLDLVFTALKSSILLQVTAFVVMVTASMVFSFLSLKSENVFHWIQSVALIGTSFPTLFLAPVLVLLFSHSFDVFPLRYDGTLMGMILPLMCLTIRPTSFGVQILSRKWRDTEFHPYFLVARAKGFSRFQTFWRHGFKNSALSYFQQMSQFLGQILTGSILVESLFSIPGLGTLFVESLRHRDQPVLLGTLFLFCGVYLSTQTIFETLQKRLEPREGHF